MTAAAPGRAAGPAPAAAAARGAWLRDNLEAIVVAIVLALLIKQFAMEAFVIPTGSMAPTLLGAHVDVDCPNCAYEQSVSSKEVEHGTALGYNVAGVCPGCGQGTRGNVPEDALGMRELKVACKRCGEQVPLSPVAGRAAKAVQATCQSCRFPFETPASSQGWPLGSVSRGDRILVNKWIYRFREPERFEVAVFKFPKEPNENYIKRLVGLPGDVIDIRDGEIYVNGHIARKPPHVQASIWIPVHDGRHPEQDDGGSRGVAWQAEPTGAWARSTDRRAFKSRAAEDEPLWLSFQRPVTDWNGYNVISGTEGGKHAVPDVRLALRAELAGPSAILLVRLEHGDERVEAALQPGQATLRWGDTTLATHRVAIAPGRSFELAVWRADGQAAIEVDGERVAQAILPGVGVLSDAADPADDADEDPLRVVGPAPLDPGDERARARRKASALTAVRIGVGSGEAKVADLVLHRDVYYLPQPRSEAVAFPYQVGPDELFALGDNASNSTDSRVWGIVPRGHLVGRAFLVFWPALPGDFAVRRIR